MSLPTINTRSSWSPSAKKQGEHRRALQLFLLLSCTLIALGAGGEDAAPEVPPEAVPEPPPLGVTSFSGVGYHALEAIFEGKIIGLEPLFAADGSRRLALLIRQQKPEGTNENNGIDSEETAQAGDSDREDSPSRSLFLLDPNHPEPGTQDGLSLLQKDLNGEFSTLRAIDLDSDGAEELLLGRQGEILHIPIETPGAEPLPLLRDPALGLGDRLRATDGKPTQDLWIFGPGELHLYRPAAQAPLSQPLSRVSRHSLPRRVTQKRAGLELRTPRVRVLQRPGEAGPLFLVGPEAHGKDRLRTLILDPNAPEGEGEKELWSRLPLPESVESSAFFLLDGIPILVVTTLDSESINLIAKKRLRVFPLLPDRTRAGRKPSLAVMTASRVWQEADIHLEDVNADGLEDLVVIQPEGFSGKRLIVEAYPGKGKGRFDLKALKTVLKTELESWTYGGDLDGDGLADLLGRTDSLFSIFTNAGRSKKGVLAKQAHRTLALDRSLGSRQEGVSVSISIDSEGTEVGHWSNNLGSPRLLDLDADGDPELLFTHRESGRGILTILWLQD